MTPPKLPSRDDYEIPVSRSLTQRILYAGVPREFAIILSTFVGALSVPLQQWIWAVPLGLAIHAGAHRLCRRDPYFFELLVRHLRLPRFFDS